MLLQIGGSFSSLWGFPDYRFPFWYQSQCCYAALFAILDSSVSSMVNRDR